MDLDQEFGIISDFLQTKYPKYKDLKIALEWNSLPLSNYQTPRQVNMKHNVAVEARPQRQPVARSVARTAPRISDPNGTPAPTQIEGMSNPAVLAQAVADANQAIAANSALAAVKSAVNPVGPVSPKVRRAASPVSTAPRNGSAAPVVIVDDEHDGFDFHFRILSMVSPTPGEQIDVVARGSAPFKDAITAVTKWNLADVLFLSTAGKLIDVNLPIRNQITQQAVVTAIKKKIIITFSGMNFATPIKIIRTSTFKEIASFIHTYMQLDAIPIFTYRGKKLKETSTPLEEGLKEQDHLLLQSVVRPGATPVVPTHPMVPTVPTHPMPANIPAVPGVPTYTSYPGIVAQAQQALGMVQSPASTQIALLPRELQQIITRAGYVAPQSPLQPPQPPLHLQQQLQQQFQHAHQQIQQQAQQTLVQPPPAPAPQQIQSSVLQTALALAATLPKNAELEAASANSTPTKDKKSFVTVSEYCSKLIPTPLAQKSAESQGQETPKSPEQQPKSPEPQRHQPPAQPSPQTASPQQKMPQDAQNQLQKNLMTKLSGHRSALQQNAAGLQNRAQPLVPPHMQAQLQPVHQPPPKDEKVSPERARELLVLSRAENPGPPDRLELVVVMGESPDATVEVLALGVNQPLNDLPVFRTGGKDPKFFLVRKGYYLNSEVPVRQAGVKNFDIVRVVP
eukprot:TRINITY_DN1244_c0_g3_i1.p1 TRINITY_DN1244_c0_g3~~TRINITY_DN1244_c0_g3_i1.p1  ORF type:complete len:751 (-),score=217.27 TRINITY_DN1244_c0_g3_i1:56-2092(-)